MKALKQILILILILFLFGNNSHQAYATNNKQSITKAVNTYMTAVKQYNYKKISNCLNNKKFFYWVQYPKMQKHIKTLNKNYYSYKIKSIKQKGDTATATVYVSFYSSYEDSKWAMKQVLNDYDSNWSGQKSIKRYISYMKDAYEDNLYYFEPEEFKTQFIFTNKTKIPLRKVNGKWKIDRVTSTMQYQMDAVTYDFMEDFLKNPYIIYD